MPRQIRSWSVAGRLAALMLATAILIPSTAHAHFMWLVPTPAEKSADQSVHLIFSELASVPEADLIKLVEQVQVRQLVNKKPSEVLELSKTDDGLLAKASPTPSPVFYTEKVFGVRTKAEKTFLLQYFAKSYVGKETNLWPDSGSIPGWKLEAIPMVNGNETTLHCTWNGQPAAGAEIVVQIDGGSTIEGQTNEQGDYKFSIEKQDLVAARVKYVEPAAGEFEGKKYDETRYYLTVTFDNPAGSEKVASAKPASLYPDVPQGVTSFGAAIVDQDLYVYGGNIGKSHDYYVGTQSDKLYRLKLQPNGQWEDLSSSTPLQGVAMVSHGGKLYRAGGFTARNKQGEKKDLFSTDEFAVFDPQTKQWAVLPHLPEPRSSHDIAVLNDKLYVVGGWSMQGNGNKSVWHQTAWVYDLAQGASGKWMEIAKPTSIRRALTLGAHQGKIYAIGGMYEEGSTTTETLVYDAANNTWAQGPDLPGEDGDGFGASSFAEGGKLYVSGISGKLHRLSEDGQQWEEVGELAHKRFFHRMLPMQDGQFILVGGSNMKTGKVKELEVLASP